MVDPVHNEIIWNTAVAVLFSKIISRFHDTNIEAIMCSFRCRRRSPGVDTSSMPTLSHRFPSRSAQDSVREMFEAVDQIFDEEMLSWRAFCWRPDGLTFLRLTYVPPFQELAQDVKNT